MTGPAWVHPNRKTKPAKNGKRKKKRAGLTARQQGRHPGIDMAHRVIRLMTSKEIAMSEQDYLEKAREILADHEAGKIPAGSAVDWARSRLLAAGERVPADSRPDGTATPTDPTPAEMVARAERTLRDTGATPEAKDRARAILAVSSGVPFDLAVKAAEYKIDVPALLKAAKEQKLNPVSALTAEIENCKLLARDEERRHGSVLDFRQAVR